MQYLTIKNWDRWQSYRADRGQPPWIKLHRCIMRNQDWVALSDAQRGQLVSIWLLAADKDGQIPSDPAVIRKLCYMDSTPDLELFIKHGFIELDAIVTPERRQDDQPETETETEKSRVDKTLMSSPKASDQVRCPYTKIVDLYHQLLPNHPKVKVLTPARKSAIRQRHIQDMDSSLEEWESYFKMVSRSEFLTGKAQPQQGRRVFVADLEWVTKQSNFAKIYEGKYHGKV